MDSAIFLARIRHIAEQRGYSVHNIDVAVILERPKLKDHIPEMIVKMASMLKMSAENISIKAKTNEGMGFVGHEEGMAVIAVVTVQEQVSP